MKTAVLACLIAIFGFSFSVRADEPGKDRWPVKIAIKKGAPRAVIDLADLLTLEAPPDVKRFDKRYQSKRIPAFNNSLGVQEGHKITTHGWFHLVGAEKDGDYHIQISDSQDDGGNCMVVEVPKDEPEFVPHDNLRPHYKRVRDWIRTNLLKGKEPSKSGNVMNYVPYVRIEGQLFYDAAHVGDKPRGKKGMKCYTLWELHPVVDIDFAPEPS